MPVVIEGVSSFMHICIMVFIMILQQRSKINIVSFFKREIILQKCKSFHNYDQCVSSSRSNYFYTNQNYQKILEHDWSSSGNETLCCLILSVIILVINKSTPTPWSSNFVNHWYDYRPSWTPLSPSFMICPITTLQK